MRHQDATKLLFLLLLMAIGWAAGTACGSGLEAVDEPELSLDDSQGRFALELPTDDARHRVQLQPIIIRNTGKRVMDVTRLEMVDTPSRLVALGAVGDSCTDDSQCGEGAICTPSRLCRATGLPTTPLQIEPLQRADLTFAVTRGATELNCPGADAADLATLGVEEIPAEVRDRYCGALIIETNAGNNSSLVEGGRAIIYFLDPGSSGVIKVSPTYMEFVNVIAGQSYSQEFSVRNEGDRPLTVDDISLSNRGDLFEITGGPAFPTEIEAGTGASWTLNLAPPAGTQGLDFISQLEVDSNALNAGSDSKIFVEVTTGAAAAPRIEVEPTTLSFDDAATKTLSIANTGSATLQVTQFKFDPPSGNEFYDVTVDGAPAQLPITIGKDDDPIEVEVAFARPAGNEDSSVATLQIGHNKTSNAGLRTEVTLLGDAGQVPIGKVYPPSFTFLSEDGNSESREFVVRNVGVAPLQISDVTWSASLSAAEFSISGYQTTIAPGEIAAMTVSFDGANATDDYGQVDLVSNNGGGPLFLGLASRTPDPPAPAPVPVAEPRVSGDIFAGVPVTFTAENSTPEGAAAAATWILLDRPAASQTWVYQSQSETVSFTPDVAGTYRLGLLIYLNDREAMKAIDFTVVE